METVVKQKQKTVYNEKLNRWERQWVDVEKCIMTEEDKIKAASEFFNGVSAQELANRYHTTRLTIFSWVDRYSNGKERVSLPIKQNEDPMAKKNPDERIRELEAENRRLEKALELEKLRAKAYDTMINVAEETFNIPIRKKSGTKQ